MNKEEAPLDDPNLRKAVAMAVDRGAIVDALFGGDGVGAAVTTQFFTPSTPLPPTTPAAP